MQRRQKPFKISIENHFRMRINLFNDAHQKLAVANEAEEKIIRQKNSERDKERIKYVYPTKTNFCCASLPFLPFAMLVGYFVYTFDESCSPHENRYQLIASKFSCSSYTRADLAFQTVENRWGFSSQNILVNNSLWDENLISECAESLALMTERCLIDEKGIGIALNLFEYLMSFSFGRKSYEDPENNTQIGDMLIMGLIVFMIYRAIGYFFAPPIVHEPHTLQSSALLNDNDRLTINDASLEYNFPTNTNILSRVWNYFYERYSLDKQSRLAFISASSKRRSSVHTFFSNEIFDAKLANEIFQFSDTSNNSDVIEYSQAQVYSQNQNKK